MKTPESRAIAEYVHLLRRIEKGCEGKTEISVKNLYKILFGSEKIIYWEAAKKLLPNDMLKKVRKQYLNFTETEAKVLCLASIHADGSTMSFILNVKKETIYSTLCRLKRKLGTNESESFPDL